MPATSVNLTLILVSFVNLVALCYNVLLIFGKILLVFFFSILPIINKPNNTYRPILLYSIENYKILSKS